MCFSSFYHKIMFSAVKNAKAVLISYFHCYNSFSYAEKKNMAYVNQLLDQPSQWQTSQQAGPGSVPKFTSTSITVKQLLIKNKNINQSKSSLFLSKFRHAWSGAQATEVRFISEVRPQRGRLLVNLVPIDARIKNCETHHKQCAWNIIIDTLFSVFCLKAKGSSFHCCNDFFLL